MKVIINQFNPFQIFFYSVDATCTEGYGRMVNDAPLETSNAKMQRIKDPMNSSIHICLFATKNIAAGREIR